METITLVPGYSYSSNDNLIFYSVATLVSTRKVVHCTVVDPNTMTQLIVHRKMINMDLNTVEITVLHMIITARVIRLAVGAWVITFFTEQFLSDDLCATPVY